MSKPATPAVKNINHLFTFKFALTPNPINDTTYTSTRRIAEDPSHPFHIRTRRRLAAFDRTKLHWAVKCPVDISGKSVVRTWAIRRVKEGLRAALKGRGLGEDGSLLEDGGLGRPVGPSDAIGGSGSALRGALAIILDKDKSIITASGEDVAKQCKWVLRKVEELQVDAKPKGQTAWRDLKVKAVTRPGKKFSRRTGGMKGDSATLKLPTESFAEP